MNEFFEVLRGLKGFIYEFLVAKQLYEPLMSVCMSVCLYVCLYVCMSATFFNAIQEMRCRDMREFESVASRG